MATLTLGGQDIRQSGAKAAHSGLFFDLIDGLLLPADVRGTDTVIPAAAGRIERNRVADTRSVTLEGMVLGTSFADWFGHWQDLIAVLDPTTVNDLVIGDSYYGTSGTLPVRYMNGNLQAPVNSAAGPYQSLSLEFVSIAPEWT